MNKRILACLGAAAVLASMMTGCGGGKNTSDEEEINVISGTQVPGGEEGEDPVNSDNTDVPADEGGESSTTSRKKHGSSAETTTGTDENGNFVVTTTAGTTAETQLYGLDNPEEELGTEIITAATTAAKKSEEYYESMEETSINEEKVVEMLIVTEREAVMTSYDVDPTSRYGYQQLSSSEQALYKKILECAKNAQRNVDVGDIDNETWIKVFGCVYMQEPELFWLASKNKFGKLYFYEIDKDVIKPLQDKIDAKVKTILESASGKSDFEKVRTFHDWIVLNNDFNKADMNEDEDSWRRYTIYGGFVQGEVQCEGYAKSMQYLCDLSGIESMIVVGTNDKGSSHAWNVIKLGDSWYNVDCTWDDPILSTPVKDNLRHRYFAVPDEWIHNKSHYNVNRKTTGTELTYFTPPACTKADMNYFAQVGKLYSDVDSAEKAIKDELTKAASSKTRVAEIRVSSKSVYDQLTGRLKDYASWIRAENSSVKKVASNCDEKTLVIELDLGY